MRIETMQPCLGGSLLGAFAQPKCRSRQTFRRVGDGTDGGISISREEIRIFGAKVMRGIFAGERGIFIRDGDGV